jgi:hypothetical protein
MALLLREQNHVSVHARVKEGSEEERHARVVRGDPRGDVGHVTHAAVTAAAAHDLQLRPR